MKKLEIGDKSYTYFDGFKVTGIVKYRNYDSGKKESEEEYEYWNYRYTMLIDDEFIIEQYDNLDHLSYFFKRKDNGEIFKTVRGNDIYLDVERIREHRLKKILDK